MTAILYHSPELLTLVPSLCVCSESLTTLLHDAVIEQTGS